MPDPKGYVPAPSNQEDDEIDSGDFAEAVNTEIQDLHVGRARFFASMSDTSNLIVATTVFKSSNPPGLTTLVAGQRFWYVPVTENTGAVDIEIDDQSPTYDVLANDGGEVPAGYFQVGQLYELVFDGTAFRVVDVGSAVIAGNRAPDAVFECQRASGTGDGDSLVNTAQERLLNTVVRASDAVSLDTSTGRFTVQPGTYMIRWSAPASGAGMFTSYLYNRTDAAVVAPGTSASSGTVSDTSPPGDETVQGRSEGAAFVTLAAAKELVVITKTQFAETGGLGKAASQGVSEVYSRVEITEIDQSEEDFEGPPGGPLTEPYEFDTDTADTDPGAGKLKVNNASLESATELYLSVQSGNGLASIADVLAYLAGGSSTDKALIRLVQKSDRSKWALFRAGSFTDNTTYYTIGVTHIGGSADAFDDGAELEVLMDRVGDAGTSGTLTNVVSPSALTADVNDYDVGSAGRQVLKLTTDGNGDRAVSGLVKKATGEKLYVINDNAAGGDTITLPDEDADSAAENRFGLDGEDVALSPGETAELWYDEADQRWRVLGSSNQVGGTAFGRELIAVADEDAARVTLNIDQRTEYGDDDQSIAATVRTGALVAALTAPRIWGLPSAADVNAGQELVVVDEAGGISSTNTLTVQSAGSDTVNGGSSVVLSNPHSKLTLRSDGISKWTAGLGFKASIANDMLAGIALPRLSGGLTPAEALQIRWVNDVRVDVTADAFVLFDASGNAKRFSSISRSAIISNSGAGGLDTGTAAPSTWYHIWGIGKEDGTQNVLLSASATAPTLPSGYTYKGYLGAVRYDSNPVFVPFFQTGNDVLCSVTGLVTNGTATSLTSLSLAAAVPPAARVWRARLGVNSSSGTNAISVQIATDSSASFGVAAEIGGSIGTSLEFDSPKEIPIWTAQTVFYRVTGTNAQATINSVGWRF